jgi:hypothetical protein
MNNWTLPILKLLGELTENYTDMVLLLKYNNGIIRENLFIPYSKSSAFTKQSTRPERYSH